LEARGIDLAAIILTFNEEHNVAPCIASVRWADQVIVFDSGSSDRTREIAAELGAVVYQHPFRNYSQQRQAALQQTGAAWALFVDADERVTPELAAEVRRVIAGKGEAVGYWLPRKNFMFGRWIQGGGWSPDYQLRLLRPGLARYDPTQEVHEVATLDGPAGYLENRLIHYNYDSVAEFRAKQSRYIDFEARILLERGVRARPYTYLTMPLREFWRRFISLRGYRDGAYGALLAALMAYYVFLTYLRLRRLR
jgi:glycosyltransferase involved in cell wall biosynthesis